jgi:hypothetical protein
MTNPKIERPEKSVEEIVDDFVVNRGWVNQLGSLGIADILKIELIELLQAERQKWEEMVEINLITALGMMSENMQRQALGESMAYTEEDFEALTKPNNK